MFRLLTCRRHSTETTLSMSTLNRHCYLRSDRVPKGIYLLGYLQMNEHEVCVLHILIASVHVSCLSSSADFTACIAPPVGLILNFVTCFKNFYLFGSIFLKFRVIQICDSFVIEFYFHNLKKNHMYYRNHIRIIALISGTKQQHNSLYGL